MDWSGVAGGGHYNGAEQSVAVHEGVQRSRVESFVLGKRMRAVGISQDEKTREGKRRQKQNQTRCTVLSGIYRPPHPTPLHFSS